MLRFIHMYILAMKHAKYVYDPLTHLTLAGAKTLSEPLLEYC